MAVAALPAVITPAQPDPRLPEAFAFASAACRWVTFEAPAERCDGAHPACWCRQRALRLLARLDDVDPLRGGAAEPDRPAPDQTNR